MTTTDKPRPRITVPAGACDCHVQFYAPADTIAQSNPGYLPPPASPQDYRNHVFDRLGLDRIIAVQPAVYGDDHSFLLECMADFGDAARGVAMVRPSVSDDELERLHSGGIRAMRFQLLSNGIHDWADITRLAGRAAELNWVVQVQLDGREMPYHEKLLSEVPGKLLIDHTGRFVKPVSPNDPSFRSLLGLVEGASCWVKLSAPYDTSITGAPAFEDVGRLARALVAAAPERMIWGSCWPHPNPTRIHAPDDAMLLDVLLHWCEDEAARKAILSTNPARLYGFQ